MNQKSWKLALAAAFASIAIGLPSANAVLIVPPGAGVFVPTTSASIDPTITAAQLAAAPFMNPTFASNEETSLGSGVPTFSGFLNQYVFQESLAANPLGGLTFAYQLDNDINVPSDPLDSAIATLGIASFSLASSQDANNAILPGVLSGGEPSNTVAGDGTNVVFTFPDATNAAGAGALIAGDVSSWLFVRTNAPTFGFGTATISGFGTATASAFVPVPEPTTVLFGLGLLGVVGFGRRRS